MLCVGLCTHGCSATEFRGLEPLELELQEVVSHSKWALGTTLQASTTAEHTPNSCTTSPAHLDSSRVSGPGMDPYVPKSWWPLKLDKELRSCVHGNMRVCPSVPGCQSKEPSDLFSTAKYKYHPRLTSLKPSMFPEPGDPSILEFCPGSGMFQHDSVLFHNGS